MTQHAVRFSTRPELAGRHAPRLVAIVVLATALVVTSAFWTNTQIATTSFALGGALLTVALGLIMVLMARRWLDDRMVHALRLFADGDTVPGFLTDRSGRVIWQNNAARDRFQTTASASLEGTLRGVVADPTKLVRRVMASAARADRSSEGMPVIDGLIRVSACGVGAEHLFWRVETLTEDMIDAPILDIVPLPLLIVDPTGDVAYKNPAAQAVLGPCAREFADRVPIKAGVAMEQTLLTTAGGEVPFQILQATDKAERRVIALSPVPEGRDSLSSGIDSLPASILHLDVSGKVLSANPAARALLGDAPPEGRWIGELMEGLGRPIADWLEETNTRRTPPKSEFLRLTRTDHEMFVQVTLSAARIDRQDRLIAVLNDATELKTLEAQFVQSQKMLAIGQLAGGVAHDFNNLLTAISGHCDLLLLRHDQGDDEYADLMQINQNANRAASLVGQLLAFSRKQTLRPEVLDVRDTLSDLTHLLNRLVGEKVTLTLNHDPVLGAIRADKRQLEQVLMNLVVNARDAMPDGGEIRIVTQAVRLTEALERDRATLPPGDYVQVQVIDEGTGIPPDKLQKVFEPFYTTKRTGEGTGLGLSTAYGIVKQTGGYIFVDSEVGAGTVFSVIFPVRERGERDLPVKAEPPIRNAPKHGEGVVLLVEDEAPVRAFATRALRLRGYTVIEAASAEEALETLQDDGLTVHVFVTDVVMPGLDGPSWVRQALITRPDVRVIFVSGYAEGAFGDSQAAIPNSIFLQKPFSLSQLTDTVHAQMNGETP